MENNSLNNILCNIEISYNKQNIDIEILILKQLHFSTGMFYQNYSNVFVILDYKITADSAVYLFTQNYTQTAIACGENK